MSRLVLLVTACVLALTAAPASSEDGKVPTPREAQPASVASRLKQKVKFDGSKIGAQPLFEVLGALSKQHGIPFVVYEEQFNAKQVLGIKDKISPIKKLDASGLTVAEFLDAWLPSIGAAYQVQADYVELIPIARPRADTPAAPARKPDPTERLLATLADAEVDLGGKTVAETPLFELLGFLSKSHGVTFVVLEEQFKAEGQPNFREEKPKFAATQLRGQSLHQFLSTTLESMGATYLVKNGTVEIVPTRHAAKACKAALEGVGEESGRVRLKEPLVSAVIKEKPLNEAVAKLAEMYDLNVVVAPQAGDAKTGFVTARLLNVPADKAVELLAVQCDLRVVRKGNAFLITSRDQSNELFGEKLERERQKIELEKLREASAAPPKPPAPEPKP